MHPFYPSQSFQSTDISHTLIALENARVFRKKPVYSHTHTKKKKNSLTRKIFSC